MVGPGGVFVLCPLEAADNAAEAIAETEGLAASTREQIAKHLAWVPFVDWFVVAEEPRSGFTVLPPDLLTATAFERDVIDAELVGDLQRLLRNGELTPLWHRGIPAPWENTPGRLADVHPTP